MAGRALLGDGQGGAPTARGWEWYTNTAQALLNRFVWIIFLSLLILPFQFGRGGDGKCILEVLFEKSHIVPAGVDIAQGIIADGHAAGLLRMPEQITLAVRGSDLVFQDSQFCIGESRVNLALC